MNVFKVIFLYSSFFFQTKFKLVTSRKKWLLQQVGRCLRNYKHTLYAENFHKYKSLAELKDNPPPSTDKDEWGKLATQWYSEEWHVCEFLLKYQIN